MGSFIEIVDEQERIEHCFGDSRLILRRLTPETHEEIRRRHTKRYRTKSGEWAKELDENAVLLDCIDYVIVGWSGVKHPVTKQDVPCTPENKKRIPIQAMGEVMDLVSELNQVAQSEAENELKNSKGSSV
jgi:hypothetical protein